MKFFKTTTGLKIPQIGLGSFDLKADAICNAIQSGYTLIDTAWQYGNEKEVGKAIKKSGKSREDIIISTKLWTEDIRQNQIQKEFDESLRNLQTDYVDIYLIHWPAVGFERAWETMAMLKEKGKIKEIGVCNFTPLHFDKLAKVSGIIPILNQIESHPYYQNANLIKYVKTGELCHRHGVLWEDLIVNWLMMIPLRQFQGNIEKLLHRLSLNGIYKGIYGLYQGLQTKKDKKII